MRNDRYAIILTADGRVILKHCYPTDGLELKTLQRIVQGPIETVPAVLDKSWAGEDDVDEILLIVNEEGKLNGMPVNHNATDMMQAIYDTIVGNAVLMAARGEEIVGLTRKAAENILKKWGLNA